MANPEQDSAPEGKIERRLVFDENRGKWKMTNSRSGHQPGQPISSDHVQKLQDGLKLYWQNRREAGQAPMPHHGGHQPGQPISSDQLQKMQDGQKLYWQNRREAGQAPMPLHVADKVSEGLKRYHQEKRKQQQFPEQS